MYHTKKSDNLELLVTILAARGRRRRQREENMAGGTEAEGGQGVIISEFIVCLWAGFSDFKSHLGHKLLV